MTMKSIAALSAIALLLIPALAPAQTTPPTITIQVQATPPPPPPPPTWTVPISQSVTILGVPYQITGTLTLAPVAGTPTPIPIPTPIPTATAVITGVSDASGLTVRVAVGGSSLYIQGSGFQNAVAGSVTIAGVNCVILKWTDTVINVSVPGVAVASTGKVVVGYPGGIVATSAFDFSLGVGGVITGELNGGPMVAGYLDSTGQAGQVFHPGDPVRLVGASFGAQPGFVSVDGIDLIPKTWADDQIDLLLPDPWPGSFHASGTNLLVQRQDRLYYLSMAFAVAGR